MLTEQTSPIHLPRQLANGLILRRSGPADADQLAEFNSRIHGEDGPDPAIEAWIRDLCAGGHPTFKPDDFLIVENSRDGKIVSSSNLISQTWSYGGIPFGVGRPEAIGTEPAFRRQGLVREQMDVLHAWSSQRGELVQAITGIPYYYRQFGYEMTIAQDGGRSVEFRQNKPLADSQTEAYIVRPATVPDIALIMESYETSEKRADLTCVRSAADWHYELTGKDPQNVDRVDLFVIESADGQPAGAVGVKSVADGQSLIVQFYGLLPGTSYLMVTPSVLRFLWKHGQAKMEAGKTLTRLELLFGEQHPAYSALDPGVTTPFNAYSFFIRVADLPGFLRLITPVLEKRLAASACSGHSGDLRISFYTSGIRVRFEHGKLVEIEEYQPSDWRDADARFPDLTFLQLLFQARSLDELRYAFTDIITKIEARALLNALFPRSPSSVWVIS
jgi:hypothetical protein